MATDPPTASQTNRSGVRTFLAALGVGIGGFVFGNVLVLVVAGVLAVFGVSLLADPSLQILVSTVMLQGIGFGGAALLYLRYRGYGLSFLRAGVPSIRDLGWVLGGIVALFGLLAAANVVITTLGIQSAQNQVVQLGNQDPTVFLLLVPLSFILIGPGEELLFRGIVQNSLVEVFHPSRAIVLASAIFAVIHYSSLAGSGRFTYLGIVFVLALVLGSIYEVSDNLVVPALVHGAYNAVQFALAYLSATGGL